MDSMENNLTKLTRLFSVSNLRGPGTDLNFLDWEFKM